MRKKAGIFIIIILAIIMVASFFIFTDKKVQAPGYDQKIFSLQDDADGIVWTEDVNVDETSRAEFNRRIDDLRGKIETETDTQNLMTYYYNITLYYKYLGDYRAAYDYNLKTLEIDPSFRRTWLNFGDVLLSMKAYKSAETAYKKSIELFNYDDLGWKKLVALYEKTQPDNHDLIKNTYEEALAILRNNSEDETPLLQKYAVWLANTGQKDTAKKIYEELMEKDASNALIYQKSKNNL